MTKTEIKDYWVCERCDINSLNDKDRMIPCPRGSCDAECKGEIQIRTKLVLKHVIKQITEDEFYEKYKLVDNHLDNNASFDGKMFETYGEEINFVIKMAKKNRVITIIDGGDVDSLDLDGDISSNLYYISGYHLINRLGYLITEKPIKEEFEVKLD